MLIQIRICASKGGSLYTSLSIKGWDVGKQISRRLLRRSPTASLRLFILRSPPARLHVPANRQRISASCAVCHPRPPYRKTYRFSCGTQPIRITTLHKPQNSSVATCAGLPLDDPALSRQINFHIDRMKAQDGQLAAHTGYSCISVELVYAVGICQLQSFSITLWPLGPWTPWPTKLTGLITGQ